MVKVPSHFVVNDMVVLTQPIFALLGRPYDTKETSSYHHYNSIVEKEITHLTLAVRL